MSQRYLFPTVCFIYTPIWSPCVSVYFVKITSLKFFPFISVFFFCRSGRQSRRKVGRQRFFFSSKHMHPLGPYISAESKEAAHCARFGALGTKKHKIKDGARKANLEAWLVFLSFFIYFPRLVAIIG